MSADELNQWLKKLEVKSNPVLKASLDRLYPIVESLRLNHFSVPVITITGTNGKGSTATILEAILLQAGFRVGLYTSPHILLFNERIRLNGQAVNSQLLCDAFELVYHNSENVGLGYFDMVTLAALVIFKEQELDIIILEVGIGGRLDACNIVDADISVITTIALDHIDRLGPDREAIGFEKAGIMRSGKPCVIGETHIPHTVTQYSILVDTPLYSINDAFRFSIDENGTWSWSDNETELLDLPKPKLSIKNAATALMVLKLLSPTIAIDLNAIHQGLKLAFISGRQEIIESPQKMIFDIAHNPEACQHLAKFLQQQTGRFIAIVGMLGNKDHRDCLAPFTDIIHNWHVTNLQDEHGADNKLLKNLLQELRVSTIKTHQSANDALKSVIKELQENDVIVVFGSSRLVGEIKKIIAQGK